MTPCVTGDNGVDTFGASGCSDDRDSTEMVVRLVSSLVPVPSSAKWAMLQAETLSPMTAAVIAVK